MKKLKLIMGILLLAIAFFLFLFPIRMNIYPKFHTHALLSVDNIHVNGTPSGTELSKSSWWFGTVGTKNGILMVKNKFEVETLTDQHIFSVERFYGIDPQTGAHIPGYGDHNRTGYFFAPQHLSEGQSFTYWHVNYDTPAHMQFIGKEKIERLTVYRYQALFDTDQTTELNSLPDVPEKYGITLEVNLTLLVEPVTGHFITYEDHANAYYYDSKTHERLHKWNEFSNRMTLPMIHSHIIFAKLMKYMILSVQKILPISFAILGMTLILLQFVPKKHRKKR